METGKAALEMAMAQVGFWQVKDINKYFYKTI
jgi:hypothetical protein